ncbi:MAG: biotin carboxylase [Actinomycetota bacterium]|nr:biotin carboxylase [Actinomycetota bacterium]
MFESVLVANRGEIARRVIRTCQRLGIKAIAVHSEADVDALHKHEADESVLLGPAPPAESYLDGVRVLEAARQTGAQAIHPGYGFLAENAAFAQRVLDAGLVWVGPSPAAMAAMGDKITARNRMAAAGVPVAPGTSEPVADADAAVAAAADLGYPVMVKASAGGGGIGMGIATDETELRAAVATARSRAERFFGSPAVLLERYLPDARHVEVQVLGLVGGRVVALGERDCSVQRRHQKVVEETPSPAVSPGLRARMLAGAVRAGEAVGYLNAGTVECLVSGTGDDAEFVFLEMNTRLQVEHPVTELVTGLDLVEQQLHIAAGEDVTFDPDRLRAHGHAIELRVYAEDPQRFLPGPGRITQWTEPTGEGVRVDAAYTAGDTVTPFYDPLLAKLCVYGETRPEALARARTAVAGFEVSGPKVNLPFLAEVLDNAEFSAGRYDTGLVDRMRGR